MANKKAIIYGSLNGDPNERSPLVIKRRIRKPSRECAKSAVLEAIQGALDATATTINYSAYGLNAHTILNGWPQIAKFASTPLIIATLVPMVAGAIIGVSEALSIKKGKSAREIIDIITNSVSAEVLMIRTEIVAYLALITKFGLHEGKIYAPDWIMAAFAAGAALPAGVGAALNLKNRNHEFDNNKHLRNAQAFFNTLIYSAVVKDSIDNALYFTNLVQSPDANGEYDYPAELSTFLTSLTFGAAFVFAASRGERAENAVGRIANWLSGFNLTLMLYELLEAMFNDETKSDAEKITIASLYSLMAFSVFTGVFAYRCFKSNNPQEQDVEKATIEEIVDDFETEESTTKSTTNGKEEESEDEESLENNSVNGKDNEPDNEQSRDDEELEKLASEIEKNISGIFKLEKEMGHLQQEILNIQKETPEIEVGIFNIKAGISKLESESNKLKPEVEKYQKDVQHLKDEIAQFGLFNTQKSVAMPASATLDVNNNNQEVKSNSNNKK